MCGNKNKINCQCDGNCDCGEVLPNGKISCDNCGWKAPEQYNALTGNYVCPSCRTESSYSSNNVKPKNNNKMENKNFSQGLVGLGAVNAGFLNWSENPIGKTDGNSNTESNFSKLGSQNMMGYATGIGQGFMLDPFGRGGESNFAEGDKKWAEYFDSETTPEIVDIEDAETGESNFKLFGKEVKLGEKLKSGKEVKLGEKLKSAFVRFTPQGIIMRDSYCGKYCKALGYARKADKSAFKKCKAACKINFQGARSGAWKFPAAPEGVEENLTPDQIAAYAAKEVSSMPENVKQGVADKVAAEEGMKPVEVAPKSNMMMYVIIGVVVLAIIIAIIIMMRKKAAATA